MPKKKQVHLTTEQIIEQSNRQRKFKEKIGFIKEKFYPALILASEDIDGATQMLSILNTIMMEKFLGKMKEVSMKEINLFTNLSADDPRHDQIESMLHLFDDMNVFEAKEYFEGVKGEIELFKVDYFKGKLLSELPVHWLGDDTNDLK